MIIIIHAYWVSSVCYGLPYRIRIHMTILYLQLQIWRYVSYVYFCMCIRYTKMEMYTFSSIMHTISCYTTLLIVVGSIYCIFIYLQTIFLIYFLHEDLKNPSCSTHNAWREQAYMNIMWHSVDILGRCRFSLERPWLNTRYKLRLLAQSEMKPLQLDDIKSQKMS